MFDIYIFYIYNKSLSATPEFVLNEMIFGKLLRMGADCPGKQPGDKRVGTFNLTRQLLEREGDSTLNSIKTLEQD